MKEWGLIQDYWQYLALPEPVIVGWRMAALAEAQAAPRAGGSTKPTQDLLAQELGDQPRFDDLSAARTASRMTV